MSGTNGITGAYVVVKRRLAWAETDAAGHSHFSAAMRWFEEAEQELWHRIGHIELESRSPRVHVEVDYRDRMYHDQDFVVTLGVAKLGRSSCTFHFEVHTDVLAVEGNYTVVHTPDARGGGQPWPDDARAALEKPGEVLPD